jgi:hypothetical protein
MQVGKMGDVFGVEVEFIAPRDIDDLVNWRRQASG